MENNNNNNDTWGMFSELPEPEIPAAPTTRNISPVKPLEVERVQKHDEKIARPLTGKKPTVTIPLVDNEQAANEFYQSMKGKDKTTARKEKMEKRKAKKEPRIRKDKQEPKEEKPKKKRGRPRKYATPEESETAKKELHYLYLKKSREEIRVAFNKKYDAELLAFLNSQENLTQYIKTLVLNDMSGKLSMQKVKKRLEMQRITHENGDEITLDEISPDDLIERIFEYENILSGLGLLKNGK